MKPGSLYKQTTIVLAEDHFLVRQGFKLLLETEQTFRLAGEAGDGLEACELVERLSPDVLVLDLMIPRLHGLEVTRRLHKSRPKTRIIILSMHAEEAYVIEALRNGASAYVLKDADAGDLLRAIREAVEGRRFLSPPLTDAAVAAYARRAAGAEPADSYEQLTTREREVLHLTAEGLTNADVGERLFISPRTAETHRANVMRKLGLSNQTDLVRYAIGRGIVAPR